MKQPPFWWEPPGWRSSLLAPLGSVYAAATRSRLRRPGRRATIPVICVGNVTIGGTGKTPTVIALLDRLGGRARAPFVLLRGYGGRLPGPLFVDPKRHTAREVGDEALLLANFAPVVVSRDRAAGAKLAESTGADLLIMDDGLQNPSLVKDLAILVVDAERGFGNGRVLPAGPLREPVAAALSRTDVLLTIGPHEAQAAFAPPHASPPRVRAELRPLETGMSWTELRVLAFAGIGRPEKFFRTLEKLGAVVAERVPLDDHQAFSMGLLTRLERRAAQLGAQLVTTEKDAVRLPLSYRRMVLTLPVRLQLNEAEALDQALERLLAGARPTGL